MSIQRIRFSTSQPTQPRGTYNYNGTYTAQQGTSNTGSGIADFLTNNMNTAATSNVFTSDDVRFNRAGYAQDDWKASQRLTVNYGLRYDYSTPYLERHDNQAALVPTSAYTSGGTATAEYRIPSSKQGVAIPAKFLQLLAEDHITLKYTDNRYLVEPQKTNFAPRVGFAFKATEKAVIHGGYGIFFGGLESTGYFPTSARISHSSSTPITTLRAAHSTAPARTTATRWKAACRPISSRPLSRHCVAAKARSERRIASSST